MEKRIQAARKAKGLTLKQLGDIIGISESAVSNIERGRNKPSGSTLILLCEKLGINREWLETGEGEMFEPTTQQDETAKLIESISDSPAMRSLLATWAQLSDENKAVFERFAADYVEDYMRRKAEAKTARIEAMLDEPESDADISDNQSSINHA